MYIPYIIIDILLSIFHVVYVLATLGGYINLELMKLSKKPGRKKTPAQIRFKSYFLSIWWVFDVISLIPLDWIALAVMIGTWDALNVYRFLRLIKLLRVPRVSKLFVIPADVVVSVRLRQIFALLVFIFYCISSLHIAAVLYVAVSTTPFPNGFTAYVTAIYWVMGTLTTVGYGDINFPTQIELVYAIIVMILGVGAYSYVIGKVSIILLKRDTVEASQRKEQQDLISLMKFYHVPKADQHNVVELYSYVQKQSTIESFSPVINRLPATMQQEIRDYARIHMIRNFPLFKKISHKCLVSIARALKPVYSDPKEVIIQYNDIGKEMYFIAYGTLEVISPEGNHLVNINKGFFGEMALFFNTKRTATIRSLTYCSLLRLDKDDFEPIMRSWKELAVYVKHHVQKKLIEIPSLYRSLASQDFADFDDDDQELAALTENDLRTAFTKEANWVKLVYEQNKVHSSVQVQQELIQLHATQSAPASENGDEPVNNSYNEDDKVIVQLTIMEAKQLAALDIGGKSDPFVIVSSNNVTHRTKIKKKTLEPHWNERFLFTVKPTEKIDCLVFDHDLIGSNDFLGAHTIDVSELPFGETMIYWAPMRDHPEYTAKYKQGKLRVQVLKSSLFDRDLAHCKDDLISIEILNGEKLIACDLSGTSDPYIIATIGDEKYKSKVKLKSLNPVWNETCHFVANKNEELLLEVFDLDYVGSDDAMGVKSIELASLPYDEPQTLKLKLDDVASGFLNVIIKKESMLVANMNALELAFHNKNGMEFADGFSIRTLALLTNEVSPAQKQRGYHLVIQNELRLRQFESVVRYLETLTDLATTTVELLRVKSKYIEYYVISNQFPKATQVLAECMKLIYPDYPLESGPHSLHVWINEKIRFLVHNKDDLIKLSVDIEDDDDVASMQISELTQAQREFQEFQLCVKKCGPCLLVNSSPVAHAAQVLMGVLAIEKQIFYADASLSGIGYSILNRDHSLTSKIIQFAELDVSRANSKMYSKLSYVGYFYATFMPFSQCNAYHQYEVLYRSFEDGIHTGEPILTAINGISALFVSFHVSSNLRSESEFDGLYQRLKTYLSVDNIDIYRCLFLDIEKIYLVMTTGAYTQRDYPIDIEDNLLTRYFYNLTEAICEYLRGNVRSAVKYMILANADVSQLFPSVFYFYHYIWNIIISGSLHTWVPTDGGAVEITNMPLAEHEEELHHILNRAKMLMQPANLLWEADHARIESNRTAKEIVNMYRRVIANANDVRLTIISHIASLRLASFVRQINFGMVFTSVAWQEAYESWDTYGAKGIVDLMYLSFEKELLASKNDDFRRSLHQNQTLDAPKKKSDGDSIKSLGMDYKIKFNELYVKELEGYVKYVKAKRGSVVLKSPKNPNGYIVCDHKDDVTNIGEAPIEEPQRKLLNRIEVTKNLILIPKVIADRAFTFDIFLLQKGVKSLLAVPILECVNNKVEVKGMVYFEKSSAFSQAEADLMSTLIDNHYRTTRLALQKHFLSSFLPSHITKHVDTMDISPEILKEEQPDDYCFCCQHSVNSLKKKYKTKIHALQKKEWAVILPDLSNDALYHSSTVKELKTTLTEKDKELSRQEKLIVQLLRDRDSSKNSPADPSLIDMHINAAPTPGMVPTEEDLTPVNAFDIETVNI